MPRPADTLGTLAAQGVCADEGPVSICEPGTDYVNERLQVGAF